MGCNVCTLMSMMSEKFMPSACEVDVMGTLTMYAMQLAGSTPAALVDWNNNYADDEDKCVLFHCGNWAKSFLPDIKISSAPIIGTTGGVEDDHTPFQEAGIPAVDLIDFEYGPGPSPGEWWHTPEDDLGKVCPAALDAVGGATLRALPRIR